MVVETDLATELCGILSCLRIVFSKILPPVILYASRRIPRHSGRAVAAARADDEVVDISVLCSALNDYCGKTYEFVSGEEKERLLGNPEVTKMNVWPAKNSVATINNVIVIKLGVER